MLVIIKRVYTDEFPHEISIGLFLNTLQDARNHTIPILDTFMDPTKQHVAYLVMPFCRHVDNPPFDTVEEVLDFIDQISEVIILLVSRGAHLFTRQYSQGLAFMHEAGIAHRSALSFAFYQA